MAEQNAINAPVSAFGKTLIDDVDQATALGTLLDNATLTSTTVATGDLVIIQDISNGKSARTVTAQSIADLAGAAAAPSDATYITQIPNGTLSAEQALSLLSTGIMKSTTATGVISIAGQGVDYYAPGGTDVAIADGGTGASTNTTAINNLVNNAALTSATVVSGDLVLLQDISDSNNLKSVTAQSIADLGPGGSAAPQDATYITQIPNVNLTNEQALSLLNTGIMKSTTATGVVSIATSNVDYQAADATLISISALGTASDRTIYTTGVDTWAETSLTGAGRALIDDVTASDQRTTLGLGTIATQNSNSVTITGGSITSITDLLVSDGGTGASTFTSYAVLCGGTTATSQIQSIANVGTSGHVLTSNGAAALPTFQTPGAGGFVTVRVAVTRTQWLALHTTSVEIIAAQGANTLILCHSIVFEEVLTGTAFIGGGNTGLQFGSAAGAGGLRITSVTASNFTTNTATSFIRGLPTQTGANSFASLTSSAGSVNTAVFLTTSSLYSAGTGGSFFVNVIYSVMTAS